MKIAEVVHDDKRIVDDILENFGIISQKDLWHKCKHFLKNLQKELVDKVTQPSSPKQVQECNTYSKLNSISNKVLSRLA